MPTFDYTLSTPPSEPRALELWLQHAAGFILFQDMREYATQENDPALNEKTRAAVQKGIDDAVYCLMMVLDGVTGGLTNERQRVNLRVKVELTNCDSQKTISEVDLADGDGMCMGYHGWRDGDFGEAPLVDAE